MKRCLSTPAVIIHAWVVLREGRLRWCKWGCLYCKLENCSHGEKFLGSVVVCPWCFCWDLDLQQRFFLKSYQFWFLNFFYYWIIESCFVRTLWLTFSDGYSCWAFWSYWTGIVCHNLSLGSANLDLSLELEHGAMNKGVPGIRCVFCVGLSGKGGDEKAVLFLVTTCNVKCIWLLSWVILSKFKANMSVLIALLLQCIQKVFLVKKKLAPIDSNIFLSKSIQVKCPNKKICN